MEKIEASKGLLDSLNNALARELQVSIQYMLQHATWGGVETLLKKKQLLSKQGKFVASHSPVYFPGTNLKKIAITEMRHAERIGERIIHLGGILTAKPAPITIGAILREIIENDKMLEEDAIQLYTQIIDDSIKEPDRITEKMFRQILEDERKHHNIFTSMLEKM